MMVTVADLYSRAARQMGARVGTLGTVTVGMTTTTAVLNGLINTIGSDSAYSGYRLIFPDSPSGSQQALVTAWSDSIGRSTFLNLTTPPVAGERYILVPPSDYTLNEFDEAWAECSRQTTRTYKQVIPITPNIREVPLSQCDWLRGAGDVDAVFWNISPIALHNEDFALWQNGAAAAPDGWTLFGGDAVIARVTGGLRSAYKARVTAGAEDGAELSQSMPGTLVQWITRRTAPVFTPIRAAAWGSTSAANAGRVGIQYTENGVQSTVWSDYLEADGVPHFNEISLTPNADMTEFTIVLFTAASQTVDWSAAVLMQNTATASNAYQIRDQGSQFYADSQQQLNFRTRNVGGLPTLDLSVWPNVPGQYVVYSRRPSPVTTSLDDIVPDQQARAMEWGLLAWLLRVSKPNQDRSRLDRIMVDAQQEWARFLELAIDLPVPDPPQQIQIWGT